MASSKKREAAQPAQAALFFEAEAADTEAGDDDVVLEGTLVCALTGEHRTDTPAEQIIQSCIEQFHREYGIPLEDMERDVRVSCTTDEDGRVRSRNRNVSLVVFEHGKPHHTEVGDVAVGAITRVVIVAKPGTKPDDKAIAQLEEVLGSVGDERPEVFGAWTNGADLAFRMRTFHPRTGTPVYTELTDIPAPDETLADLESAERRPLRVAAGDSLLRAFKRCHDYLYGNQNMRGDRAFWQLLYLIFAKILDERSTSREFFVGATERNTEAGRKKIAGRIRKLFERVKVEYDDVFDGNEKLDLNDRALGFIAAELSRYSLLSTDTDAKGMAYEAITSTTLKRERGQFFTPRNVIKMMVDIADPQPGQKVLDPACGSGGFLVVALGHARRRFLADGGCPYPDQPVPREIKKIEPRLRKYAETCLFGIDVDPELRKAARMNMVMNNDGHGNIGSFNSLEFGIPKFASEDMTKRVVRGPGRFRQRHDAVMRGGDA